MAYRDPPLVAPKPVPNAALPARLLGAAALVLVVFVVTKLYAISDDTYLRWYKAGSSMPSVLYWVALAFRFALVPGAAFFGLRADSPRARTLAWVGAGLVLVSVLVNVWVTLHPVMPEYDRSRPYWAPSKRIIPWTEHVAVGCYAVGLAAVAWALARRESRTLATVATVFAFAVLFRDVMSSLEVPWIQLYSADKHAAKIAGRMIFFMNYVETFAVGLAGLRYQSQSATSRPTPAPVAAPNAAAYDGFAPLVAAVTAAAVPLGMFGTANAWMTMARGERDFDNWMSASGIVRIQYFEDMAYLPYGALLCAAGFLVWAAGRARQSGARSFLGVASLGLAIVSISIFLRGRWKVPISSSTDFTSFQVVWALLGAGLFFVVVLLARRVGSLAQILATEERDDLHPAIASLAKGITVRLVVASVLAAATMLAIAFGDLTTSTSLHETLAGASGIAGALSAAVAMSAAWIYARRQGALVEALRRREEAAANE